MILVRLKVASFKLKQLTIDHCARLEELEIDAVNLSYLYYAGFGNIEFKSVPALVEAKLFGDCCTPSILICQKIASFAMQLSRLSLVLVLESCDELPGEIIDVNIPAKGLPCFSNLRCLELTCLWYKMFDFPSITRLLGACPLLREFKMEVDWGGYILLQEEARVLQGLESLPCIIDEEIKYKAFPRLKVLEYVGYDGSDDDADLLLYLLDVDLFVAL